MGRAAWVRSICESAGQPSEGGQRSVAVEHMLFWERTVPSPWPRLKGFQVSGQEKSSAWASGLYSRRLHSVGNAVRLQRRHPELNGHHGARASPRAPSHHSPSRVTRNATALWEVRLSAGQPGRCQLHPATRSHGLVGSPVAQERPSPGLVLQPRR